MPLIPITTPFNVDIEFEVAEFYKRLFAYLTDFFLIIIYLLSMLYLLFGGFKIGNSGVGFVLIVLMLPMLFYTLFSELWFNGQTLGKKIFKIKVASLDGGEPSLEQYILRWFMRFYEWGFLIFFLFWENPSIGFLILFLGSITSIIIILTTRKNQRLGDVVAGTVVINTRSKLTVKDTIFMNIAEQNYQVKFKEVLRLSDRDVNTIKSVLSIAQKTHKYDMVNKVATKVREVLNITDDNMYSMDFLEKIMEDYTYLSTRE
jgi:uncharacterized RDD family membrane protein YckC